ncbi:MAG: hypothetical protein JNK48_30755 [Bryobacterales bacterium]|nr:hypothetical protein [Bryobacterales bacterium]
MLGRFALLFAALSLHASRVELILGPQQQPMKEPFGVAFDRAANMYVVEHKGEVILRASRGRGQVSRFAGTGEAGNSGDSGPAADARMFDPHGIAISRDNSFLYVADTRNHTVRRIHLRKGIIDTIAGTGQAGFSGDGGPAVKATFNGTFGIALSPDDRALYIADLGNKRIRKVDLRAGIVTTVAGNGQSGVPADGAPAKDGALADPRAVAVDSRHRVYVLERNGNALRVIEPNGTIRTVVTPGSVTPVMKGPKHLCIDREDRVVIADAENHLIRRYDPKSGVTSIIAGTGTRGAAIDPDDPLRTELNRPHGVYVARTGDLYISDSYNHRILRVKEPDARSMVRLEIQESSGAASETPYQRIAGVAHFRLDPSHRLNREITNIARAARNSDGLVEFSANFFILKPKNGGNRTLLFEVSNRGGKGMLNMFSHGTSAMDPRKPADFGNESLLRQGYTLAWLGWQHDVAKGPYALRLAAPKAVGVAGNVRSQFVADQPTRRFPLTDTGHVAYAVADPRSLIVTERGGPHDSPTPLPPSSYVIEGEAIVLDREMTPGRIYEATYLSRDPEVAMLGLAAIREFVAHLRQSDQLRFAIGFGVSQSAMLLRAFLHHGFNEGLNAGKIFDGVFAHTAGGRRAVYPTFAQPSRTAAPLRAVGYGTEGHPLERVAAPLAPKVIYSNSSYEYWGATASLLHTTRDGKHDAPVPENVRIYMLAGGQHGPSGFPPSRGRAAQLQNPNDYRPIVRALLDRLREWITEGKLPPDSVYPRIGAGTLVAPAQLNLASGIQFPAHALQPFDGSAVALVPQVDSDGNDLGGVRTPDLAVPLAAYTGWNLRTARIGHEGELIGNSGSFLPFSREQLLRRYPTLQAYFDAWEGYARKLADQGLLLPEEIPQLRIAAQTKWEWIGKQNSSR